MTRSHHTRWMTAALLLLALSGCNGFASPEARFKEARTITWPHEPAAALHVITSNGAVSVRRADVPEATIQATIGCISQQRLDATQISVQRKDNTLRIEPLFPGGRPQSNEFCSFQITLPGATGVTVDTSNGSITIAGLGGKADLHTSNGEIRIEGHAGPATARTSNGRLDLAAIHGPVDASTTNGAATVRLTDDNPGPVKLRSSNGNLSLAVGKSFTGRLNYSTTNGAASLTGFASPAQVSTHARSGHIVIGSPDQTSDVSTSNGSIHLLGPAR